MTKFELIFDNMPASRWWWGKETRSWDELARETAIYLKCKPLPSMIRAAFGYASVRNSIYVGDFNVEEYWSENADEPNLGALRVDCPGCGRRVAPHIAPARTTLCGGWRWVGLSHQEPYTDYFSACGWCGQPMLYTIHTPQ